MAHQIRRIKGGIGGRNNPGVQLGRRSSGFRPETLDSSLVSPPNASARRSSVSGDNAARRSSPLFPSPRGRARRDQAPDLDGKKRRGSPSMNPSFNCRSAASRSVKESRRTFDRRLHPCSALFPPSNLYGRLFLPLEMQGRGRLKVFSLPQAFSHRLQASPSFGSHINQPPEPCFTSPAMSPVLVHYEEEFPPLVASQPNPLRKGSITLTNHSRSMPVPPLITPPLQFHCQCLKKRRRKRR